jgi:multidrug resistance efflux pump
MSMTLDDDRSGQHPGVGSYEASGDCCGDGPPLTVSTVFTGSMVSDREAILSFQTGGQLKALGVQEGGTATGEEVLGRLDDVEAKAQVLLAEANLRAVQAQLQRATLSLPLEDSQVRAEITQSQASLEQAAITYRCWQDLYAKGAVARQQVEDAQMCNAMGKSRYDAAMAALTPTPPNKKKSLRPKPS